MSFFGFQQNWFIQVYSFQKLVFGFPVVRVSGPRAQVVFYGFSVCAKGQTAFVGIGAVAKQVLRVSRFPRRVQTGFSVFRFYALLGLLCQTVFQTGCAGSRFQAKLVFPVLGYISFLI